MVKLLAAVVLSGCSFMLMSPPATEHDTTCSTQLAAPVTDTVISTLALAALGASVLDASLGSSRQCVDCAGPWQGVWIVAFVTVPVATFYGVSAVHGWHTRRACKQVHRAAEPAVTAGGG